MRPLSSDLEPDQVRPYFLWDEDLTVAELRQRLRDGEGRERLRLMAKLLREARDTDVWKFTSPTEVAALLPRLAPFLGRRRRFWEFLIGGWRRDGFLPE